MLNFPQLKKITPLVVLLAGVVALSGCGDSSSHNATNPIPDKQIALKAKKTVYLQEDDQISTCNEYAKEAAEDGAEPVTTVRCASGDATVTFTVNMLTGERSVKLNKGTAYIYRPVVN